MVFRTGATRFDQITPAKLDNYEKLMRRYAMLADHISSRCQSKA